MWLGARVKFETGDAIDTGRLSLPRVFAAAWENAAT